MNFGPVSSLRGRDWTPQGGPITTTVRIVALAAALSLVAGGASAASLDIDDMGRLLGASDVNVGGLPYDVEFVDGTCIDLFSGCDSASDFTFMTESDALLAARALLDQVFVEGSAGPFDSVPSLVAGCEDDTTPPPPTTPRSCSTYTPYTTPGEPNSGGDVLLRVARAFNGTGGEFSRDDATLTSIPLERDTGNITFGGNWARWTLVPEPSTALLLAAGLMGLSTRKRSRH